MTPLYGKMFSARVGRIFSNISITAAVICALSLVGGILAAFYIVFMVLFIFAAIVCTVGIVLAYYPNIFDLVNAGQADSFIHFLFDKVAPPTAVVAFVAGALALLFLLLGEPKKDMGRIVFSAVVTALGGVLTIVAFLSAGNS